MAELESVIEKRLIDQLCCDESQWTYRPDIRTEEQLWDNFKYILEQNNKAKLNDIPLSESEFAKIKNDLFHASFYDAGKWLIGENGRVYVHVQRGNETLHLVVMNNEHIAGGTSVYEVINQYQAFHFKEDEGSRNRRFDVSLLINGIPLIHIELKNKEHSYMDGFRQIKKYIAESKFHGIFSNVQMFVVSNAVDTKYFAAARDTELNKKFISGWLDKENLPVCDYIDFAKAILKIYNVLQLMIFCKPQGYDNLVQLILRQYNGKILCPSKHLYTSVFRSPRLVVRQDSPDNIPPLRISPNPVHILFRRSAVSHQQDMLLIVSFFSDIPQFFPQNIASYHFHKHIDTEEHKHHGSGEICLSCQIQDQNKGHKPDYIGLYNPPCLKPPALYPLRRV